LQSGWRRAEEVRRIEAVDWIDDPHEILACSEAARLVGKSDEAIRRWCSEAKIGRMFARGLWLISRRRLLQHHGSHRPSLVHRGLTILKALRFRDRQTAVQVSATVRRLRQIARIGKVPSAHPIAILGSLVSEAIFRGRYVCG
jgi:hypothetical protein